MRDLLFRFYDFFVPFAGILPAVHGIVRGFLSAAPQRVLWRVLSVVRTSIPCEGNERHAGNFLTQLYRKNES